LRPAALIVYIGMLLATPLMGGHYFVDVIAGIVLAVLAIAAAKRLSPSIAEAPRVARENSGPSALPAGENCDAAALFVAGGYVKGANSAAGTAADRPAGDLLAIHRQDADGAGLAQLRSCGIGRAAGCSETCRC